MALTLICKKCSQVFIITDKDLEFYNRASPTYKGEKLLMLPPTFCPDCRLQRRLSFRNERNLFRRLCDLCEKETVSLYDAQTEFPVYCHTCWWSDKWDPKIYGRDFDFNRPFFEQYGELFKVTPKVALLQLNNENCDYNALIAFSKNTYMSPGSYYMEDAYYVRKSQYSKDCLNGNFIDHCEMVAESTNCKNCYNSHHMINAKNCSDCAFMADTIGCKNCFMCSGISGKEYCIKNIQYTKEEYEKNQTEKKKLTTEELWKEFMEFNKTIPKKYQNQTLCENSTGDYLQECNNATECYDCYEIEDSKYLTECVSVKDSMDLAMHDKDIELCYEMSSGGDSNYGTRFCFCTCASPNSSYLNSCFYLQDSFGCDGFHSREQYCILNKKYTKEEYESLVTDIIKHMMKTGEWGEFFPTTISPFPYNHSVAQDYFPLTKAQAKASNFLWGEMREKSSSESKKTVPKRIEETPSSITKDIMSCMNCEKNYRIIQQELELSRKINISLSPLCANCRALQLMNLKNPRKLYDRKCSKCQRDIQTTYSSKRPETIFCAKCNLETKY